MSQSLIVNFGDTKRKYKVELNVTLSVFRNKINSSGYAFVDTEGVEIVQEDEHLFDISEIYNEEQNMICMKQQTKRTNGCSQNFNDIEEQIERDQKKIDIKQKNPKGTIMPLSNSKEYKSLKKLDIYLYPQIDQKELSPLEKQNMRVIMVIGATGSGKTTVLDAMVNYLEDVPFEANFRYKLIDELSKGSDQTQSFTKSVSWYCIKTKHYPIIVIDTPGFMDTEGIQRDLKTTDEITDLLKSKIDKIHCVCLVSNSTQVKQTWAQMYIYQKVFELFGKDIQNNIVNFFTFSDFEVPLALQSIEKENIPTTFCYKFNNSVLFTENKTVLTQEYWEKSKENLHMFFEDLRSKFTVKSLGLTNQVLKERQQLELTISHIQPKIKIGLTRLQEAKKELILMDQFKNELNSSQGFQYKIQVQKTRKIPLNKGIHTTTCLICERTCHENCAFANDEDKAQCIAINNDYCIKCVKKCFWKYHSNSPYIIQEYIEEEERTKDHLLEKYCTAQSKITKSAQILKGLNQEQQKTEKEIFEDIQVLKKSLQKLSEIALRPQVFSSIDVINQMIRNEEDNINKGYESRLVSLNELKNKCQMILTLQNDKLGDISSVLFEQYYETVIKLRQNQK